MSLQNVLTAPLFKRDPNDRLVMFPNGVLGRGYLVPDAGQEMRLRRTLMWVIISAGLLGGVFSQVAMMAFGSPADWPLAVWAAALLALAALTGAFRLVANRLAQGLEPSEMRLGAREAWMRQAEAMPRWYLWTLAVGGGLMVAGSVMWMVTAQGLIEQLLGLLGLALFGGIVLQAVLGLKRPRA